MELERVGELKVEGDGEGTGGRGTGREMEVEREECGGECTAKEN